MEYSEYYKHSIEHMENSPTYGRSKISISEEPENEELTPEIIKDFCSRLSGILPSEQSKAIISYQSYKMNENEEYSAEADNVYQLMPKKVVLSYDVLHPDLATLSICFGSHTDPALRIFWRRLNNFYEEQSKNLANEEFDIPVFMINLLERESIGGIHSEEVNPDIYEVNIINPLICYLTRELPTDRAIKEYLGDEEVGGNVVKMLISLDTVNFIKRNDIDVCSIKASALLQATDEKYNTTQARDDLID